MSKGLGKLALGAAALLVFSLAAADEIVYFTNGAEMPVRSHSVEKDKEMVKLDLGGNSFISFPLSMVDKIADAGRDVFLNPAYHPANQAVEGSRGPAPLTANAPMRNSGGDVGYRPYGKPGASPADSLGEPTIGTEAPSYSKSSAGVTVAPIPHSHGLLQKATIPTVDQSSPFPQTGQAVIMNPNATPSRGIPLLLKPFTNTAPASPPPAPADPSGEGPPAPTPPPPPPEDGTPGQS